MSTRNEFFAGVFTRELERWKKENHSSQEAFATAIGVEPNMIGRYKKGTSHPSESTLERITNVLGVEKSVFYPSSMEDLYKYDENFRKQYRRGMRQMQYDSVRNAGIDLAFWGFLWRVIPYTKLLFPMFTDECANEEPLFYEITDDSDDGIPVYRKDLEFIRELQEDVEKQISMQLIKSALWQKLRIAQVKEISEAEINRMLDTAFSVLVLQLLKDKEKEEP